MSDVLGRASELEKEGHPYALATVVRVDRPVSARPGDHALVTPDGRLEGWVGGSCSEPLVVREALAALAEGTPRLLRIMPAGAAREPNRPEVIDEVTTCASNGGFDIFVEPRLPAPRLAVAGSSAAARGLVLLAKALGYRVLSAVDDPADGIRHADDTIGLNGLAVSALGPGDSVVVATMGRYDEEALEAALHTDTGYVGLVASVPRGARVTSALRSRGVSEEDLARVVTPAGLDLGPLSQDEIGLAVLADIVARRNRMRGGRRERPCPRPDDGEGVDPICGMRVAMTPAALRAEHQGVTRYFCSEHCRRAFVSEPERYLRAM